MTKSALGDVDLAVADHRPGVIADAAGRTAEEEEAEFVFLGRGGERLAEVVLRLRRLGLDHGGDASEEEDEEAEREGRFMGEHGSSCDPASSPCVEKGGSFEALSAFVDRLLLCLHKRMSRLQALVANDMVQILAVIVFFGVGIYFITSAEKIVEAKARRYEDLPFLKVLAPSIRSERNVKFTRFVGWLALAVSIAIAIISLSKLVRGLRP